ncbi:MAG: hypothetical protein WBO58_16190, partial [Gammaproteobacteria bacterium]
PKIVTHQAFMRVRFLQSRPSESNYKLPSPTLNSHWELKYQEPLRADTVEKLDKNGGLFFCNKPNHHELLVAASM